MSRILVRDCSEYDQARVDAIIEDILDFSGLSFAGRAVLVKPNLLLAGRPEQGITTHPVFVRALVGALRARGAVRILVGDNPGVGFKGQAAFERLGRTTGMGEAAGGCLVNIGAAASPVEIAGKKMLVSKEVLRAEVVISLPRFKTHSLTGFTGAIKNMFGMVVGSDKVYAHRHFPRAADFSRMLADVCAVRPPDLTILDAIVVMEGNGPSAGSLRKMGKILASTDPVALDSTMAWMIGLDRERIPMLQRARELGLGTWEETLIEGKIEKPRRFRLPVTASLATGVLGYLVNRFGFSLIPDRVPALIDERCTGCGQCAQACPSGAMKLVEKRPVLDRSRCISCFCCHELCPEHALKLKIKW